MLRHLLLPGFGLFIFAFWGCSSNPEKHQTKAPKAIINEPFVTYQDARSRHEKGDLVGARQAYDAVLAGDAFHIGALGNRAILHEGSGDLLAAIKDYDQLLKVEQGNVAALMHRAALHSRVGNLDLAINDYDTLLIRRPNDPIILNDRGYAYFSLGKYEEALKDFEEALRQAPKLSLARFNRGSANYFLKKYPLAKKDFQEVLLREPKHLGAINSLGLIYLQVENQLDSALQYFGDATEIAPQEADGWFNLGNAYYQAGQLKAALAAFSTCLGHNVELIDAHANRALTAFQLNRFEDAISDYDWVLEKQAQNENALVMRGLAKCEIGQFSSGCLDLKASHQTENKTVRNAILRYCK